MKKNNSFLFAISIAVAIIGTLQAQSRQSSASWNVQEISMTKWNSQDGIPYMQAPGVNLGAVAFDMIAVNKIAFLSNASNEIIITDRTSGKAINRFPVTFAPRDFVYDNGVFYVLGEKFVIAYNENGKLLKQLSFPGTYLGIERVTRFNNATYLLLPSGNCFQIESGKEHEGWITSAGNFVFTKLNGDNSYSVKLITNTGKIFTATFNTDKTVAGVYVVGATQNRIFLDVQTYITQSPISVERKIVSVDLSSSGIGSVVANIKVPDCYYVLSNNDFHLSATGNILNMMTSPQGAFVFTLTEVKAGKTIGYPASLTNLKYHFNDHLIQVEAK
jgi:hypothetical protein